MFGDMWTALVPVSAAGMFFHFVVVLIYGYLSSRRTLVGPHENSRSGRGECSVVAIVKCPCKYGICSCGIDTGTAACVGGVFWFLDVRRCMCRAVVCAVCVRI